MSNDHASPDDIEHCRSRGVRYLAREFISQDESDVVLGEQHLLHALEILWLVMAHPEELRQSKAGQYRIGRVFQYFFPAHYAVDEVDLRLAALIAPDGACKLESL